MPDSSQDEAPERESSELGYRSLIEALGSALSIATIDGKLISIDDSFVRMTGYSDPSELLRMHAANLYVDPAEREEIIQSLLSGKQILGKECRWVKKDGSTIWVSITAVTVEPERGGSPRVIAAVSDISEKKRLEGEVERGERRFKALIERSAEAITLIGKDGSILFEGPSLARLTGFSEEERMGKNAFSNIHPEDVGIVRATMSKAMAEPGKVVDALFRSIRKDGAVWWTEGSAVNRLDDPDIGGIVVNFRDVTERVREEEELRDTQRLSKLGSWKWLIAEKRFVFSDVLLEVFGLKREGMTDDRATLRRIVHPDDAARVMGKEAAFMRDGIPGNLEFRVIRPDGTIRWIWVVAAGLDKSPEGNTVSVMGFAQDITDRKETEIERLRLEQRLQSTQRIESLGILAGGIAHDFNNLLGGIYGFVDLALAEAMPERAAERLRTAMSTIERARGLTRQLLTFAKGGAPVRRIGPLFPLVEETARFALSGSKVSCVVSASGGIWDSAFDQGQIGQVVDNIAINALQAMPEGGTLFIEAANAVLGEGDIPALPAGRYIALTMRDTGAGIPPENLGRIFEPFFSTKAKGSGLGLSMSYSIVKRHGGEIVVESGPGGASFTVYLPAADAPSPEEDSRAKEKGEPERLSAEAAAPSVRKPRAEAAKRRILVMDDEESVRLALAGMLSVIGYEAVEAVDGKEAVAAIEKYADTGGFDAAILDLTIPGSMGGRAAAERIRGSGNKTPLIVSSGYADDPVMSEPAVYGFASSISKPFTMKDLKAALDSALKSRDRS
jgi:PAS domain S-box-containing protein